MTTQGRSGARMTAPLLDFSGDAHGTVLARGPVKIPVDSDQLNGHGEAALVLRPRPGVHVRCSFDEVTARSSTVFDAFNEPGSMGTVILDGLRIDGWFGGPVPPGKKAAGFYETLVAKEPVQVLGDGDTMMHYVLVHLFNLKFLGSPVSSQREGSSVYTIWHIDADAGPWVVRIRTLPGTNEDQKELRESGGCRLTHIAEVSQRAGQSFTGKTADEVLDVLQNFLWFAKGSPCDLVCPSGFDQNGQKVWSRWSSPRNTKAEPVLSWFDQTSPECLEGLFPGLMDKWTSPGWRDALATAIDWYANANQGRRVDFGIILSQVALERMAYEYCVRERQLESKRRFNKLRAAERIRMMLEGLEIPTAIPSACECARFAAHKGWADGPHALTGIRNELAHPDDRARSAALSEVAYVGLTPNPR